MESTNGSEWGEHSHEEVVHGHSHFHITHNHNGLTGGFDHLSSSHEHEHDHKAISHAHHPHQNFEHEHLGEAHVHDHSAPVENGKPARKAAGTRKRSAENQPA